LPTGTANGIAFSRDGNYVAVAHKNAPYLTVYSVSGDTYTKLADPSVIPGGECFDVDISDDGTYIAVAGGSAPRYMVYKRSGSTLTKLPDLPDLPGTGSSFSVGISGDGTVIAFHSSVFDKSAIYSLDLADDSIQTRRADITATVVAVERTGSYVAFATHIVGTPDTVSLQLYNRNGDLVVRSPDFEVADALNDLTVHDNGVVMGLAFNSGEFGVLRMTHTGNFDLRRFSAGIGGSNVLGISMKNASAGSARTALATNGSNFERTRHFTQDVVWPNFQLPAEGINMYIKT